LVGKNPVAHQSEVGVAVFTRHLLKLSSQNHLEILFSRASGDQKVARRETSGTVRQNEFSALKTLKEVLCASSTRATTNYASQTLHVWLPSRRASGACLEFPNNFSLLYLWHVEQLVNVKES
jgi:hypothetical protein